jgi:hypothetical protein
MLTSGTNMNIKLNVKDFVWKKEASGDIIGELTLNNHRAFQRTFTPADTTLTIDNSETNNYGIFTWIASNQNYDLGGTSHEFQCHTISEKNILSIPPKSHKIIARLLHI